MPNPRRVRRWKMAAKDPSEARGGESLLGRWARRKHQATRGTGDGSPSEEAAPPGEVEGGAPAPREPDTPPPGDADMPPLDSLGPESDYSGFMSPRVSDELRRLALRKLFHSPLYNITDGLDDYDDDFRSFAVLSEAFHAKKARSSATESTEAAGTDRRAAGEADRDRSASPEGAREAEADAAVHSDGEDAEVAAKRSLPDPDVRAYPPSPAVSGDLHPPAEGGEVGAEPSPDDAEAPSETAGLASRQASSAGSSGEHEEGDGTPGASAGPRAGKKAPVEGPGEREGTEGRAVPGRGTGDGSGHG